MDAHLLTTPCKAPAPRAGKAAAAAPSRTASDARRRPATFSRAVTEIERLAATIFQASAATVFFGDEDRRARGAAPNLSIFGVPQFEALCAHTVRLGRLFVAGASTVRRIAGVDRSPSNCPIGFFVGLPILSSGGDPQGVLTIFDPNPRPRCLSPVERATLTTLALQIATQLELHRAVRERDAQVQAERELARKLSFRAEHDTLTGLPNRAVFQRCLTDLVNTPVSAASRTALMLVDVDHFKQVNDSLGHDAGDALLRSFAARLSGSLRRTDVIARLGGDEFGAILHGIESESEVGAICRSLEGRLREPLTHKGRQITCHGSIGIAIYPDHARTPDGLMKCADLALASAKEQRGRAAVFRTEMSARFDAELEHLAQTRHALASGQIAPGYQPKVDLRSNAVVGFEALARLVVGDSLVDRREMFATAFRDRELALALGARMLTRVLDDMQTWRKAGVAFGRVAINSCAADFASNDFGERVLAALAERDLEPALLEVEVTEGTFLGRGSHHVARALQLLSAHGVRIALDDFGTGFASLSHLKAFPVDVLKIDRTFVADVDRDADNAAIVRALISLAKSLGVESVAEGIETLEQAACVTHMGCCTGQGFRYGPAWPAHEVPGHLDRLLACRAA